jgi:hypothetical protein
MASWDSGSRYFGLPSPLFVFSDTIFGPGKTVLASLLVEECMRLSSGSVAFFYSKHNDPQRDTFLSIGKALLKQLLKQNREMLPFLYDERMSSGETSLGSVKLCRDLLETMLGAIRKTFVILDGIDECPVMERRTILTWFTSIFETFAEKHPGKLRGMIISQHETDIQKLLHTPSIVRLTQSLNKSDIEIYVQKWSNAIQRKFDLLDAQRELIVRSVCDRAEGEKLGARKVSES